MSEHFTQFDYLLNSFEAASQAAIPFDAGYGGHRKSLFAYVRDLERRAAPDHVADTNKMVLSDAEIEKEAGNRVGGTAYKVGFIEGATFALGRTP